MTWPRRGSERAIALAKRRCRARAGALRAPIHIDRHILNYDLPWNPMRLGVLWLQVPDFGGRRWTLWFHHFRLMSHKRSKFASRSRFSLAPGNAASAGRGGA